MKNKPNKGPHLARPYNISLTPYLNDFVGKYAGGKTNTLNSWVTHTVIESFDLHEYYYEEKYRIALLRFAEDLGRIEYVKHFDYIKDKSGYGFDRFYLKLKDKPERAVTIRDYSSVVKFEIPIRLFADLNTDGVKFKKKQSDHKGSIYRNLERFIESGK